MELERNYTELHQKITSLNEAQEQNQQLQQQLEHSQVAMLDYVFPQFPT